MIYQAGKMPALQIEYFDIPSGLQIETFGMPPPSLWAGKPRPYSEHRTPNTELRTHSLSNILLVSRACDKKITR